MLNNFNVVASLTYVSQNVISFGSSVVVGTGAFLGNSAALVSGAFGSIVNSAFSQSVSTTLIDWSRRGVVGLQGLLTGIPSSVAQYPRIFGAVGLVAVAIVTVKVAAECFALNERKNGEIKKLQADLAKANSELTVAKKDSREELTAKIAALESRIKVLESDKNTKDLEKDEIKKNAEAEIAKNSVDNQKKLEKKDEEIEAQKKEIDRLKSANAKLEEQSKKLKISVLNSTPKRDSKVSSVEGFVAGVISTLEGVFSPSRPSHADSKEIKAASKKLNSSINGNGTAATPFVSGVSAV